MSGLVDTRPHAAGAEQVGTGLLRRLARNPWTLRIVSLATLLIVWQLVGESNPYSISDPAAIYRAFVETWQTEVLPAFGETLSAFVLGYLICVVVGIPLGLVMARSRLVEIALGPYVSALYATPRLALIPVMIIWFGVTFELRLAVVIISGVFPIVVNTWLGAKEVDRNLLDAGVAFAGNQLQLLRTIVIPGSLHYIFAGLRIGLGRALVGTIVAEIVTSVVGVGHLLEESANTLLIAEMWVAIILLGFFALACSSVLKWGERWATMPWTRRRVSLWPSRP